MYDHAADFSNATGNDAGGELPHSISTAHTVMSDVLFNHSLGHSLLRLSIQVLWHQSQWLDPSCQGLEAKDST